MATCSWWVGTPAASCANRVEARVVRLLRSDPAAVGQAQRVNNLPIADRPALTRNYGNELDTAIREVWMPFK